MRLIDQLPTSAVCRIVERLSPRLYINFFQYLPAEICLKILGFLDPVSLINTARASREWMLLALDRKLWEGLYTLEGFRVIRSEVEKFEEEINADRSRFGGPGDEEHASKRRATPQRILPNLQVDDDYEMVDADIETPPVASIFGPLTTEPKDSRSHEAKHDPDVHMTSSKTPPLSSQWTKSISFPSRHADKTPTSSSHQLSTSSASINSRNSGPLSDMSSLVVVDRSDGKKKLNWQYLYSQRRRLEANWEAEKYTNFQLPHPDHPEEAHEEWIYTIQFSGRFLVSGSRDRTLRIWDLNTKRLVRPPLRAHNGSVLCLQFDADPDEDLLVSGSSDATVVLWRFSTGQVLQRLRKAHRESVLNVRFDKRVLVTCSKDKTIKIFNRRPIYAGELDYPENIKGVNPVPRYLQNYGYNPAPTAGLPLVPPYTMIGCLEGHGAAVNAVQIHGDEVVSASGDRTVKAWNWREQTCTRTFVGHSKGIACVQYDGRRIVSGSSDNEVKVFDRATGLEVASLRTHTNLVRTVQAGFGDLPYSSEEDQEEAQRTDREYFKAIESGMISPHTQSHRGPPRNAGSKRPEDITAYGGKLPPGGGGGRFGRIISGSYDETIIIWRRDKEGVWRAQHTLRQEEAARTSSRAARQANDSSTNAQALAGPSSQTTNPSEPQSSTAAKDAAETYYEQLIDMIVPQGPMALRQGLIAHPQMLTSEHLVNTIQSLPTGSRQVMSAIVAQALYTQQQTPGAVAAIPTPSPIQNLLSQAQVPPVPAPIPDANPQVSPVQSSAAQVPPIPTAPNPAAEQNSHPATAAPPQPQAAPPVAHSAPHHHLVANMARVFKLQFDARRIICCSQTSIIVGWDFANEDPQLIEASRFFAPIE